jgi:hypothetical protein
MNGTGAGKLHRDSNTNGGTGTGQRRQNTRHGDSAGGNGLFHWKFLLLGNGTLIIAHSGHENSAKFSLLNQARLCRLGIAGKTPFSHKIYLYPQGMCAIIP